MDRIGKLIEDLVSETGRILSSDDFNVRRGILLRQDKYRERVYEAFLGEGFVSVFRDGIDEPRLPDSHFYIIDLDDYFKMYGVS